MKKKQMTMLIAAVLSASLALTACSAPTQGGDSEGAASAEEAFQRFGALKGDDRRSQLVEAAEREGSLSIYTTMTADVADELEAEFEKAFDIDVETYRAGSSEVLTKVRQEFTSGTQGADVVENRSIEMRALNEIGVLAPYEGGRRDLVPAEGRFENWTASRYNVFSPSWNTDAVKPDEVPTSWEDLADPKWDGRLVLGLNDYDWYMTLSKYWEGEGKSDAEIANLWADIADGADVQESRSTIADLQQAGKFELAAANYTYIIEQKKRAGAPLEYLPLISPVFARPNGFGLVKDAAHPAAAMLYADWYLEEGQQILYDDGLSVAIVPDGADDPLADAEVVFVDDEELMENDDVWEEAYHSLLGSN